ncbi:MAG: aldo/keto reductase [Pseudoxanthomonas sp.]
MQTCRIPNSELEVARIGYGCMHLSHAWDDEPVSASEISATLKIVGSALELGIALFDHADIYARGKSELLFGQALRQMPGLRDRIVLQSKCGIRFADDPRAGTPARYDFSHDHILSSVEGSLRRLGTDHLDILLLHRPDPLAEPAEVASAFDELQRSGKVRHFGVSNHSASQISLLRKYVDQPLSINQIELSLLHHHPISESILVNQTEVPYTGATGLLDYCRENDILIQAWSPLAGGRLSGAAAALAAQLAQARGVTAEAILLAWLLKHPAQIQPIVGTTHPERLAGSCQADDVELSREEWYSLLAAVRGASVP